MLKRLSGLPFKRNIHLTSQSCLEDALNLIYSSDLWSGILLAFVSSNISRNNYAYILNRFIGEESYSQGQSRDYLIDEMPTWCVDPLDGECLHVYAPLLSGLKRGKALSTTPISSPCSASQLPSLSTIVQLSESFMPHS
jgi:Inositol monophosphatase family